MTRSELLDARGVVIEPGDTVIYGFSVSRSVAMAEAVVLAEESECTCRNDYGDHETREQRLACPRPIRGVSLTASGRVRLRVVRRSYSSGEKPVVPVMPDRLVVLKTGLVTGVDSLMPMPTLPPSPLPTQNEVARVALEDSVARYMREMYEDAPDWWVDSGFGGISTYQAFMADQLADAQRRLRDLDV